MYFLFSGEGATDLGSGLPGPVMPCFFVTRTERPQPGVVSGRTSGNPCWTALPRRIFPGAFP